MRFSAMAIEKGADGKQVCCSIKPKSPLPPLPVPSYLYLKQLTHKRSGESRDCTCCLIAWLRYYWLAILLFAAGRISRVNGLNAPARLAVADNGTTMAPEESPRRRTILSASETRSSVHFGRENLARGNTVNLNLAAISEPSPTESEVE